MGCKKEVNIEYTDLEPIVLDVNSSSFKVVQLTDIHLMYKFDAGDRDTYSLFKNLIPKDANLIILSGDLVYSAFEEGIWGSFVKYVDSFDIPWTFIFGNHDACITGKRNILRTIYSSNLKNLLFKIGPDFNDGHYGNFIINVFNNTKLLHTFFFFDTGYTKTDTIKEPNDYLSQGQISMYSSEVVKYNYSTVFIHIPLVEYEEIEPIVGTKGEAICPQSKNTGFFQAIVQEKTRLVMAGHDHENDFIGKKDIVFLGYGRASGYNGYGKLEKGVRIFEYNSTYIKSYVNTLHATSIEPIFMVLDGGADGTL
jgi:predicted phosphodiesterase